MNTTGAAPSTVSSNGAPVDANGGPMIALTPLSSSSCAARCVAAGARVVKHNGEELTARNIGMVLATRDLMTDLRSADPFRPGGGRPFSKTDRSRFLDVLDRLVRAAKG
jgi:hypothetical protein